MAANLENETMGLPLDDIHGQQGVHNGSLAHRHHRNSQQSDNALLMFYLVLVRTWRMHNVKRYVTSVTHV